MSHSVYEVILWLLLIFFIGCIVGYFLHWLFASGDEAGTVNTDASGAEPAATPPPAPVVAAKSSPTRAKKAAAPGKKKPRTTGKPKRPKGLAKPRGGKADDLQQISGVGPKLEHTLHGLGFFHFSQIADWTPDEVTWVNQHLRFKGRIDRDNWMRQARQLAKKKTG